jgi:hypothetical protein
VIGKIKAPGTMTAINNTEKGVQIGSPPYENDGVVSPASSVSLDKDVAIGLVGEHAREIDPAVEAKVLRKIDWYA